MRVIATPESRLNRRERRKLGFTRKAIALTMAGLMLGGGYFTATEALNPSVEASALGFGPGIGDQVGSWTGSYTHANGTILYCLELGKLPDMGNSAPALNASSTIPAYTTAFINQGGNVFNNVGAGALSSGSSQYKRLAYLLGKYGQTQNNQQAAALAIAVWEIRGEVGKTGDYDALLNYERQSAGSAASNQANAMLTEASNWHNAGGSSGSGATQPASNPELTGIDAYSGTLKVKKGTSKITLKNAVFEDGTTEKTWADGIGSDAVYNWVGMPPESAEFGRYYTVEVTGEYVYFVETDGTIYTTPGNAIDQSTGYAKPGVPERKTGPLEAQYIDPDTLWAPQLTTQTPSEFVKKGEKFADTVTFFAADAEPYDEWRHQYNSKGEKKYAPITAKGTLYGPFLSDPALNPSATVPNGAPVAWEGELTTDSNKGPGTYEVPTNLVAKESGYYTFVWDIDFEDQHQTVIKPQSGASSIPTEYFFTDGFGQATEGQTVPTSIEIATELSDSEIIIGNQFTDEIDVSLVKGGWLQGSDGKRLPYTLEGTVYASEGKPEQQSVAPADAREITTVELEVNDRGVYESDKIRLPLQTKESHITVQWCVIGENQPGESLGKVEDFCDDYGVPSETAEVLRPEVTTQAQEEGAIFGKIKDSAEVGGHMPDLPAEIDFTAYLKPEAGQPKYDENWDAILDENGDPVLWKADEVNNAEAVCEAQPVAKTDRVKVDGTGNYDSPEVLTKSEGTIYWVEELFIEDPDTEEDVSVHRGECGLPNETTIVEKPEVTTQAQEVGAVKGDIKDVALVKGKTPDTATSVDFTLFLKPEAGQPKYDENWDAILDENGDPVLWKADEVNNPEAVCEAQPVAKTDRVKVDGPGEYDSPTVRAETEGTGYWVEELFAEHPETGEEVSLHRGECGLPNETTEIEYPNVKTKAVEEAFVGDKIYDIAIVDGPLSERSEISYEVTFEAYHRDKGVTTEIDENLCTADTKVWESTEATPVATEGEYKSEKWKLHEEHVGEILWVETLWEIEKTDKGEQRSEIHRGACGEEDEITKVKELPKLAFTGSVGSSILTAGGIVLLLAGGATFLIRRRVTGVDAGIDA